LLHGGVEQLQGIRQKIEPDPRDPSIIKTVRLGGYIFTPTVETA